MRIQIERPTKAVNSEIFYRETGFTLTCVNDEFFLTGEATEKQLKDAYAAHNPPAPTEKTVAEKLASVGLSIDDLKAALA
jgi:hypothetical protein